MSEPQLSMGSVFECLKAICADNGVEINDLPPGVYAVALEHLAPIAKAVAEAVGREIPK